MPYDKSDAIEDAKENNKKDDSINMDVYEGMRLLKEDFNCIDPALFSLPSMGEMFGDDIIEERFSDIDKENGRPGNPEDAAFYSKGPYSTELGYDPKNRVFVLRVTGVNTPEYLYTLNKIDGDTIDLDLDYIDDGDKEFYIDNIYYRNFKDYCNKNGMNNLKVRFAYIDAPELPHMEVQAVPSGIKYERMKYEDAKNLQGMSNVSLSMLKNNISDNKTSISQRKNSEVLKFYKYEEDGKTFYKEVVTKKYPYGDAVPSELKNGSYQYDTIVVEDQSNEKDLLAGYRAQNIVKNALNNSTEYSDVYLVLDSSSLTSSKVGEGKLSFDSWFYSIKSFGTLIGNWERALKDVAIDKLKYKPYGIENHGRFIGTVYLKKHTDNNWVNLSKFIASGNTNTELKPDFEKSPEEQAIDNGLSPALQGSSYNKHNHKFVDLYNDLKESYIKKFKIQKEITGIDFEKNKDCTVMLGDTLLIVPPTSIRNTNTVQYEKKNILRGKGSMMKEGNREQVLEIDTYFYNEPGLNGIPYTTKLPNGDEITYYMNGLRSIVAQFRVAPFLPIENGYINDILCIEAVTLESLRTSTVEGVPGLIKAVLTLRDFNYRVYMPDAPASEEDLYKGVEGSKENIQNNIDENKELDKEKDEEKNEEKEEENKKESKKIKKEDNSKNDASKEEVGLDEKLDEVNPMVENSLSDDTMGKRSSSLGNVFAGMFDWDLFRYHYQKAILKGELLKNYEYGTVEYIDMIYGNKNVFQRANLCNSKFSFYVPSDEWLDGALQSKKDREKDKTKIFKNLPLDESGKEFVTSLQTVGEKLNKFKNSDTKDDLEDSRLNQYKNALAKLFSKERIIDGRTLEHKDILASGKSTFIDGADVIRPVLMPIINDIENTTAIEKVIVDEKTEKIGEGSGYKITYILNLYFDSSRLSKGQIETINDLIRDAGFEGSFSKDFQNGILKIYASLTADKNGRLLNAGTGEGSIKGFELSGQGLDALSSIVAPNDKDSDPESAREEKISNSYENYRDPKAMEFVPYIDDIIASNIEINMSNIFTQMYLKSLDGYAPQYMGAQDVIVDVKFYLTDTLKVSLLNNLASFSSATVKKYRKILPSWPMRVRNDFLQMLGLNEMVIETSEVNTVEGTPGLFEVTLRLVSIDRTMREREALRKVGQGVTSTNKQYRIRSYFEMEKVLSKVDVYPDLDLPSLEELSDAGFDFAKYYLNNDNDRAYPDPDFYIVYSHLYTSALIKLVIKNTLIETLYSVDAPKENTSVICEDLMHRKLRAYLNKEFNPDTQQTEVFTVTESANEETDAYEKGVIDGLKHQYDVQNRRKKMCYTSTSNEQLEKYLNLQDIITYLTACDVQKGWTIKPNWIATKCDGYTNLAIKELYSDDPEAMFFESEEKDEELKEELEEENENKEDEDDKSTDEEIEDEVEKIKKEDKRYRNAYAKKIAYKRKHAVYLIDEILNKPIDGYVSHAPNDGDIPEKITGVIKDGFGNFLDDFLKSETPDQSSKNDAFIEYSNAVEKVFGTAEGIELLDLLCPLFKDETPEKVSPLTLSEDYFSSTGDILGLRKDLLKRYMSGFLFASACALSGKEAYGASKKPDVWYPRKTLYAREGKDSNRKKVPFAIIEQSRTSTRYAQSESVALNEGIAIGQYAIKKYTKKELKRIFSYDPVADIMSESGDKHEAMYPKTKGNPVYRSGCMDRYYNGRGWDSQEGKLYRKNILSGQSSYDSVAFLRIVLLHLRKLILNGVFFSEIDILAEDYDKIRKEALVNGFDGFEINYPDEKPDVDGNDTQEGPKPGTGLDLEDLKPDFSPELTPDKEGIKHLIDEATKGNAPENEGSEKQYGERIEYQKKLDEMFQKIIEELPTAYAKSFASRMIYPFILAVTDADESVNELIESDDTSSLDALTANPLTGQTKTSLFDKFLGACVGIHMFPTKSKADASETSSSQKVLNLMLKNIYINAAEDPRLYVMHSYYDMLVNDKRGRLVRAFPTYYMMFIDEGREVGAWRLFDNFYSMSAISDINIVKSRKNPADTCTFSMNNMFDSYSDTYDLATSQQYTDIYGIKDIWTSIFSPQEYVEKEDIIRKRLSLPDKTVLKPGVRIHLRIGYGSDASNLPIGFNGKISELKNGPVIDIVAQGDGHELTNPLNALGEVTAVSINEAQDTVTAFKDIRGALKRGGLSPKELMASILCAKHGGVLKNFIKNETDGQFFNDNPFGINSFGDHKFKNIFPDGEPIQNIFEVSAARKDSKTRDVFDDLIYAYDLLYLFDSNGELFSHPTLNTTLHDKTAWQILEMCANAGTDYYGAIRDFGMRSTVFLGRPHDYIAWKYITYDDKILEKRKPFQQFHYYNSYTDIVYNAISASEDKMKTNAVGTWQQTNYIWGKTQATVGPIYLDYNIYPENQKSMTVDTGLISAGNGGIDVPLLNRLSETTASTANDEKVNTATAEMITLSCLKNSVKDMYSGELCIIGDPTAKPYDRMSIDDVYEDMSGTCEMETVIQSMNGETGFTTTIIPDVIVKPLGTREMERQGLELPFRTALALAVTTNLGLRTMFSRTESKFLRALTKSNAAEWGNLAIRDTKNKILNYAGLRKYLEDASEMDLKHPNGEKKLIQEIFRDVSDGTNIFSHMGFVKTNDAISQIYESLKEVGKSGLDVKTYLNLIDNFEGINMKDYKAYMENVARGTRYPEETRKEAKKILSMLNDPANKGLMEKNFAGILHDAMDQEEFQKVIYHMDDAIKELMDSKKLSSSEKRKYKRLQQLIQQAKNAKGNEKITKFNKILKEPDFQNLFKYNDSLENSLKNLFRKDGKISKALESIMPDLKDIKKLSASEKFVTKATNLPAAFSPTSLLMGAAKTLIINVGISNVKAAFSKWLKNLQSLMVFPMVKNSRPLLAGMNGSKGAVFGYPPTDPSNSVQGIVIDFINKVKAIPYFGDILVNDFIISENQYKDIIETYKESLGMNNGEYDNYMTEEIMSYQAQKDVSKALGQNAYDIGAATSVPRVQSFNTNGKTSAEYNDFKINELTIDTIGRNERVLELLPIEDDPEIKEAVSGNHDNIWRLDILHSNSGKSLQIDFESGSKEIMYMQGPGSTVFDMPILREDAILVLKQILMRSQLQSVVVTFASGTRVNSQKTWQNTGFVFILKVKASQHLKLRAAVESTQKMTKFGSNLFFAYKDLGDGISISVYPPKHSIVEAKRKEKEEENKTEK